MRKVSCLAGRDVRALALEIVPNLGQFGSVLGRGDAEARQPGLPTMGSGTGKHLPP